MKKKDFERILLYFGKIPFHFWHICKSISLFYNREFNVLKNHLQESLLETPNVKNYPLRSAALDVPQLRVLRNATIKRLIL